MCSTCDINIEFIISIEKLVFYKEKKNEGYGWAPEKELGLLSLIKR